MVISEFAVINLQALAAVFMSLDYFLKDDLRGRIETVLKSRVRRAEQYVKGEIEKDPIAFKRYAITFLYMGITYLGAKWVLIWGNEVSVRGENPWLVVFLLLAFFVLAASSAFALMKLVEGVFPYGFPLFFYLAFSAILRCPKGVLGAIGIAFLVLSFICRYVNIFTFSNL